MDTFTQGPWKATFEEYRFVIEHKGEFALTNKMLGLLSK